MVVNMHRFLAAGFLTLLLLSLGGCNDVPLDIATYRTDTLAQIEPVLGGNKHDTIPTPYSSKSQSDIDWKAVSFTWLRMDSSGVPRRKRLDTVDFAADRAHARLRNVIIGGRPTEVMQIDLRCSLPEIVTATSTAEGSDLRTRLQTFILTVPQLPIIDGAGGPFGWAELEAPIDDDDKGGASITATLPTVGTQTFETGRNDSHGKIRVVRIDRRRQILYARVWDLAFRINDGSGPKIWIPISMDLILKYQV
jgi:hypothetical protein